MKTPTVMASVAFTPSPGSGFALATLSPSGRGGRGGAVMRPLLPTGEKVADPEP